MAISRYVMDTAILIQPEPDHSAAWLDPYLPAGEGREDVHFGGRAFKLWEVGEGSSFPSH